MSDTALKAKFCVVCGLGSHREDWQSVEHPACDSHSKDEVKAAIQSLKQKTKAAPGSVPADTSAKTAS